MSNRADRPAKRVELGRFGKVNGVKGWIRLNSFTAPPEKLFDYQQLVIAIDRHWTSLEIDEFRTGTKGLVVHVKGYDNPETSRQLTGKGVWIDSSVLPTLQEHEYYWHQLQGLQVINQHGEVFGQVEALMETGANDVLVVKPGEGSLDERERLIPYLPGAVIAAVDLDAGTIRVNWEKDYLE